MSTLTVFNQTVTDLLPARKPVPAAAPEPADRPEFDRQLKDAGERYSEPEQPVDKTPAVKHVDDDGPVDQPATATETDSQVNAQNDSADTQPDEGEAVDTTETASTEDTPAENSSEPVLDQDTVANQPVVTTTTVQAAAATVLAEALLQQQAAVPVQSTETAAVQTTVTESSAQVQQPQAVSTQATQATQNEQAGTTPTRQVVEAAANLVTGPVQPQQQKDVQATNTDTNTQNQSSATTERIAVVAEARQQGDANQSGTNDTAQQDRGALKANTQAVQAPTTQVFAPTVSAVGTGIDATAGVQPVSGEAQVTSTSSTSQAAPSTQTQDANNTQLNTARIARGLQNAVQQKGGAVTLRLTPPEMGTVRIQLQMQNGTVTAQFHAETESTRTLLSQQMSQLRSSLEQQGLTVDRLGVQTMNQSSGSSLHNESQSEREGQANDGRSRGGFTRQGDNQQQQQNPDEPSTFDQELTTAA